MVVIVRDSFVRQLLQEARRDPDIVLIVGDLGYGVVDQFASELPGQFVNAGVAEQNMMGVAAGLGASGFKVFVYSIGNFPSLRAFEQIRNDVCLHQLPVNIVSVGPGFDYGTLGYSHFGIEDLAAMRSLPGIRIICPGDSDEAAAALSEILKDPRPTYLRLDKSKSSLNFRDQESQLYSRWILRGSDAVLIGLGSLSQQCIRAAHKLIESGWSIGVVHLPVIKPLDTSWLVDLPRECPILTFEEHVLDGGFGSAVLEALNDSGVDAPIHRFGVKLSQLSISGDREFLRDIHGLSSDKIAQAVEEILASRRKT